MKYLHILRSEPDDVSRLLIQGLSSPGSAKEVHLYDGPVDYGRLVEDIFASDRVICWWASRARAAASRR
ncbi:MAG TPA: hypothetical protein VIX13_00965 [Candidatus Eisenbacteria bacterium]